RPLPAACPAATRQSRYRIRRYAHSRDCARRRLAHCPDTDSKLDHIQEALAAVPVQLVPATDGRSVAAIPAPTPASAGCNDDANVWAVPFWSAVASAARHRFGCHFIDLYCNEVSTTCVSGWAEQPIHRNSVF